MKKILGTNKLLLSILLTTSSVINLNAGDSYTGLKLSKLDSDKTVIANTSGYAYIGQYERYEDFSLVGIEFQKFYSNQSSPFLWGGGGSLMLNDGKLLDGGMLDFDFKIGGHFDKLKAYGIIGMGIQSLSDYTVSTGLYLGIGATYDVSDKFGVTANYTKHNMSTSTSEDDFSDDQDYKLSGFSLGILYKY